MGSFASRSQEPPLAAADTYDVIVVGGGSAGCAVAGRLAAAGRHVLLVEAGGDQRQRRVRSPFFGSIHLQGSDLDWKFQTTPQEQLHGRRCNWPRGRVLGGSGSINQMLWVRGDPRSFDDWEKRLGCSGWGYQDVLPYFRRSECFQGPNPQGLRGQSGPIHVSRAEDHRLATEGTCKCFMEACRNCGIPINDDYNGIVQEGVSMIQANVKNGVRWETATAYLNENLNVLTNTVAKRLVLDGHRAVGVELVQGDAHFVASCRSEVVLCCGAIGTPQLLLLSGIGPKSHLEEMGLECQKDLQVGANMQDHVLFPLQFQTGTLDFSPSRPTTVLSSLAQYVQGKGVFAFPPAGVMAFTHSGLKESPAEQGNDIQFHMMPFSTPFISSPCAEPQEAANLREACP